MVRTEKVDGFDQKQLFNLNADNRNNGFKNEAIYDTMIHNRPM